MLGEGFVGTMLYTKNSPFLPFTLSQNVRFLMNIREKRCEDLQLQAFTVAREAKGRCEGLEMQAFTLFRTENQGLTIIM